MVSIPEKLASGGRFAIGGAYLIPKPITKITARTVYVTVSQYKDFQSGVSHSTASAMRKAGELAYKGGAAAEKQARAQIEKHAKNKEQLAAAQYHHTPTHDITYINTAGVVAHDYFWKENLRRMHEYRDWVAYAKRDGDGRGLRKFRNMTIVTYDGPGLSGYDNKNTRIYPETSLRKILKVEAAMTGLQKAQYEADINYRHLRAAA